MELLFFFVHLVGLYYGLENTLFYQNFSDFLEARAGDICDDKDSLSRDRNVIRADMIYDGFYSERNVQ